MTTDAGNPLSPQGDQLPRGNNAGNQRASPRTGGRGYNMREQGRWVLRGQVLRRLQAKRGGWTRTSDSPGVHVNSHPADEWAGESQNIFVYKEGLL